ncbi:uncharacterized protein N7479_008236 [Penicillium vulpinum]|uniref:Uncharacterized protein n=1 Tax=Penicillium vulpinum TaxID=29845 RepID=A0A1V6RJN4_9EURO|nr:uncharacterized protein N7479_008236 [Penicillium vulpinum]KAJ5961086.1 hypothetical protein N7479_008236 [Penicillium vulpinum]OQE01664.1 hypothetical protein PENVUL_c042G03212 [Penicillium vulpinum]
MAPETPAKLKEVLVVTPHSPPVMRKRKVTPSLELSSPNKMCILSPDAVFSSGQGVVCLNDSPVLAPSKRLFPLGEATINTRSQIKTHTHLESSEVLESEPPVIQIPPSRHVILPFNLREKRTFHRNSAHLMQLFPDTKTILFDGYFMVFLLSSLPPKPWPLTIAGVQPYFTTDADDTGPLPSMKRMSKSRLFVDVKIDVSHLPPSQVDNAFQLVFDFFAKTQISITQVQYWGNFFMIVLENEETDMSAVPRSIGCCNCFYLFDKEVRRPTRDQLPARKLIEPTNDIIDNSKYDTLRPGVILSYGTCSTTDSEYLTTSGVLVEDSNSGERYITVASHGFPNDDKVFHPCASGKEIGRIIMEITHTDIAIVKLHDDIPFVNNTFESTIEGIRPTQLQNFVNVDSLMPGDSVYMNSPFVGYSEGICGPHTRNRIPHDDPSQPTFEWVRTRWCYMGQGSTESLREGVCGSAIWDKEGNVIGFFRFAPTSGHFLEWSFCVGADHIIERGFKIARESGH